MSAFSGPVGPKVGPAAQSRAAGSARVDDSGGFEDLLHEKLVFSQHATSRMQKRGIHLTQNQRHELSRAMEAAQNKGSKQAAVIMGPDIFIVAPQARTVITSLSSPQEGMKVITQVDAVVYVSRTSTDSHGPTEGATGTRQTAGAPTAPHWSLLSLPEDGDGTGRNS
ncbi:MAG: flagellar hook associated protein [Firmicutes bacterium]|jgi:flagellar operon protein|uniref:Flagellar hook associated protein n=1 Tax=Sulfobacillus benefaciens TaxID=453960 RepID=A0A2T2X6N7_9FIRM|nr:flagellar hook associated protein [Bacillota bacterium]MCL5015694.1 flagellar hook associated protein [Bacillota bacterium]PSR30118.1 MAG: flagellar hook associated protein [Sulfobacillus benefaciens]